MTSKYNSSFGYLLKTEHNDSFGDILKTENIEPLIELINKLSDSIEKNGSIINRLTFKIDNDFKFPDSLVQTKSSTPDTEPECDAIKELLKQKYNLHQIDIDTDVINKIKNPIIKGLMLDNERLAKLTAAKKEKNRELYDIIQKYEEFIMGTILPSLRQDVELYWRTAGRNLKSKQIPTQFKATHGLWAKYSTYITYLERLSKLCEKLMDILHNSYNNEECLIIEQKLISINELKLNLQNHLVQ